MEMLGAERLVYCRFGDEFLIVRTDESQATPEIGATIHVAPASTACTGSTPKRASGATDWPYPRWIARGAGRLAPESTLVTFRLGANHGACSNVM